MTVNATEARPYLDRYKIEHGIPITMPLDERSRFDFELWYKLVRLRELPKVEALEEEET